MDKRWPYAVAGLLLAACGSDSPPTGQALCDKASSVSNAVNQKIAACVPGGQSTIPTGAACTSALTQCNSSDQALLNGVLDCLNALPTLTSADCTNSTKVDAWITQADECTSSSKLSGMSSACYSAGGFSGSSGSTGATGAINGSCTTTTSGITTCMEFPGQAASAIQTGCGGNGTFSTSACPTTNRVGKCTLATYNLYVYGTTATTGSQICSALSGTWTPT